jgi:hypothetical protein
MPKPNVFACSHGIHSWSYVRPRVHTGHVIVVRVRKEEVVPVPVDCRRACCTVPEVRSRHRRSLGLCPPCTSMHAHDQAALGVRLKNPSESISPYFASRLFSRLATPVAPRSRARRYQNTAVPESPRKPRRWGNPEETGSKVSANLTAARATPASAARS